MAILDDTAGEFVTDVDGVLLTAANGIHLVVFVEIVDDQIANHAIDAGITRPVVEFDRGEVERLQERLRDDGALGDDFGTHVVLHAKAAVSLRESDQLLNGDVEEGGGFLG